MLGRGRGRPPHPEVLTPAEQRVLEELRRGGTNAEIAVRLGRSPETVRTHIASMLAKLDLTDRHELAAWRQDGGRKRLLGFLAIPPALGSVGRPLGWVGAAAGGIAGAAVVVVLLVIFLGEAEDERVGATGEMTGAPVTASDMRSAMPGAGTIGTGDGHTCALRDTGEVVCWGSNDKGQADAPAGKFRWLSAGQDRTCAVAESGEVRCWGDTEFVRCQPSSQASDVIFCRNIHVSVSGVVGVAYRSVSVSDTVPISRASEEHLLLQGLICAVRETGEIDCWGSHTVEGLEAPDGAYRSVSAGSVYLCAVRDTGKVDCWWVNIVRRMTRAPAGTYHSISVGGAHVCGVRDTGELLCWGDLLSGRVDVPSRTYRSVDAGPTVACAVRESGEIDCFGSGPNGFPPSGAYRAVSVGASQGCAVRESGEVDCWQWSDQ